MTHRQPLREVGRQPFHLGKGHQELFGPLSLTDVSNSQCHAKELHSGRRILLRTPPNSSREYGQKAGRAPFGKAAQASECVK